MSAWATSYIEGNKHIKKCCSMLSTDRYIYYTQFGTTVSPVYTDNSHPITLLWLAFTALLDGKTKCNVYCPLYLIV